MTILQLTLHVPPQHDTDDLEYTTPSLSCIGPLVPASRSNVTFFPSKLESIQGSLLVPA